MTDRVFTGVWIPREIWLDERLNALDKVILTEIISLDDDVEHCRAGNDYLAQFCQCSESKVTKAIAKLIDLGYIEVFSFNGRVRKLRGCLGFFTRQTGINYEAASEIVRPINIKNNIKNKDTENHMPQIFPGFDDFWKAYPNKKAKTTAIKAWNKLKPDDALLRVILKDIDRRVRGEWNGKDKHYIPHPTTYLNQRRWEDEDDGDIVQAQPRTRLGYYNTIEEQQQAEADTERILQEMRMREGIG